jgi:tetratricopeptide (TPR) repeat protein
VWLEKAIEVLRNALRVNLEGEPLLWATIQNSLGSALARLGQRETGTTLLEEAIAAFGEALKKRKRELDPLGWAMTQTNLGNALAIVSQRKSSTTYLQQAVEAFRAALQEYTQKRTPREWATTQDSLGNALSSLAQSEKRPKEQVTAYGKALLAFGEALKERTRDRMPIEWAATQMNLGLALLNFGECEIALGERDNGITRVEKAVVAFGEALKERTRDRLPLQWAEATFNQGLALMTLANLRNDLDVAVQALSRINAACEVFRHLGHEAHAIRCEAYLSTRARPFVERLRYR